MQDGPKTYRDHLLSIYQSAAAEVARRAEARQVDGPPGGIRDPERVRGEGPDDIEEAAALVAGQHFAASRQGEVPGAGSGASRVRSCAELGLRFLEARLRGDEGELARLRGQFTAGTCDPAWAGTLLEYARFFGPDGKRATIPYVRPSEAGERVIEVKAGARVALLSDWGTGASPAAAVMGEVARHSPDLLIHLGDIYYSGTPRECDLNFKRVIAAAFAPGIPPATYVLAGNHDMYCGGVGYYDLIRTLNPEPMRQRASYFCIRSADERWQLLAMDTGLHDYAPLSVADALTLVEPEEVDWHRRRVAEFPGRTILLSHHQAFSAFSPIGGAVVGSERDPRNPNLMEAYRSIGGGDKVAAWFWGHEHSLCVYQPYSGVSRGRCIGHGAVPVFASDDPYAPLPDLREPPTLIPGTGSTQDGAVWAHGYALLRLGTGSAACVAEYHQVVDGRAALSFSEEVD